MSRKLELLEAFLNGWQGQNENYVTEYESNDFLGGTMYAIDRMKLQIQNLKKDDNRRKSKKVR